MDMIDAHDAHNPFTGIFELEILAKLTKLFWDVLQWGGGGQTWNLSFLPCPDMMILAKKQSHKNQIFWAYGACYRRLDTSRSLEKKNDFNRNLTV